MRCLAGSPMKFFEWKLSNSLTASDLNLGIKGHQGLGKIAGISRDTLITGPQHGMRAVETFKCCTSRTRLSLVAIFVRYVPKVRAASALQDIATE